MRRSFIPNVFAGEDPYFPVHSAVKLVVARGVGEEDITTDD